MNSKKNIFFIGGIHGVGKGTICRSISDSIHINSITASSLLKWEQIPESADQNKKVKSIPNTQERLLKGITQLNEGNYLLDGHFCLLNSEEQIVEVPVEIFKSMNPINLAVVTQDPSIIVERLYLRDKSEYDVKLISAMQNAEINHAEMIAKKLEVQLFIIQNDSADNYVNVLTSLIKN